MSKMAKTDCMFGAKYAMIIAQGALPDKRIAVGFAPDVKASRTSGTGGRWYIWKISVWRGRALIALEIIGIAVTVISIIVTAISIVQTYKHEKSNRVSDEE